MRIITILSGIILVGTGVWVFFNPGASLLSMGFLLGVSMLQSGLIQGLSYYVYRKKQDHTIWQLPTAALSIILASLLLFDAPLTDGRSILFFGLWILNCGIHRAVASLSFYRLKIKGVLYSLLLGLASIGLGIYSAFHQDALGLTQVLLLGFAYLLEGLNTVTSGILIKPTTLTSSPK